MSDKSHSINLTRMWRTPDANSGRSRGSPVQDDSSERIRWIDLTNISMNDDGLPARLLRNFNRPTGLNADSNCELVFENLPVGTICQLNGQLLGTINDTAYRFSINQDLQANNQILLKLPTASRSDSEPKFSVRLEIW